MFQITKRFQTNALALFIIIMPLVYTSGGGDSIRLFQEKLFQMLGMILVCLFIGNIWISAFMAWNIFLYYYHGQTFGGSQLLNIFVGSLLFMVSRKYFVKSTLDDIKKPVLVVTGITLVWMVFQLFHIDPIFMPQAANGTPEIGQALTLPLGSFALQAANGIYLLIASLFISLSSPILAMFMIIPIALSKSSAVFISAVVAILFYVYHLYRKVFLTFLITAIVLFGFLVFKDQKTDPATFGSRLPMWHSVIKKSMEYPLGYGPDSFRNTGKHKNFTFNSDANQHTGITYKFSETESGFVYYSPSNNMKAVKALTDETQKNGLKWNQFNFWDNPHCEPIKILFEYGIVGVIIMFGFLKDIADRFRYSQKDKELVTVTCCLLVFFVSSLTQFPFCLARIAYLFPILLGSFYAITDLNMGVKHDS